MIEADVGDGGVAVEAVAAAAAAVAAAVAVVAVAAGVGDVVVSWVAVEEPVVHDEIG